MSHAIAEFAPGNIIDFNSNCSAVLYGGHSTFGFIEYRISEDAGETFSEIHTLPYSLQSLYDGVHVISVEKAVACDDGRIVAICLRNDAHRLCEPWNTPMTVTSTDGGKTWGAAKELCPYKGRVYDAVFHDGVIYVLQLCNDGTVHFCGQSEEHVYRIYISKDRGETFQELCVVPVPFIGRGYGSLLFDEQQRLHMYAYHLHNEMYMEHVISEDFGKTWSENTPCYVKEGIRNPQTALLDGVYILHGRNAACDGFVLYTSTDGQHFDEGTYLGRKKGLCYYSNNIVLQGPNGNNRLLVQYSELYGENDCVNVKHLWISIHKK